MQISTKQTWYELDCYTYLKKKTIKTMFTRGNIYRDFANSFLTNTKWYIFAKDNYEVPADMVYCTILDFQGWTGIA